MFEAGLVLEGGAERGVFTAGALDYLMERGIEFSYVCGASAGACNGVDFVSKQIGRSKAAFIPKDPSYRMAKLSAIPSQHALIDMDMLFDAFPNDLIPFDYDTYFASPVRCEMVVTNAVSGEAEYRDDRTDHKRFMDICRASSSIPVFARMVDLDGTPYVDGGVGDSIPLVHSMKLGYRKNFVILTQKDGTQLNWQVVKDVSDYNQTQKYSAFIGGDNPYSIIENPAVGDDSNILGKLYNGDVVEIQGGCEGSYVFVYSPKLDTIGWVNAGFLK